MPSYRVDAGERVQRLLPYVGRRLLLVLPVLFVVILVNFFLIHATPGDPIDALAGDFANDPAARERLRAEYGLDRPILVQFGSYLLNVVQLDLGYSFRFQTEVSTLIADRIPATLLLTGTGFVVSTIAGGVLGVAAGRRAGSAFDKTMSVLAVVGQSTPAFLLGVILLMVFGARWDLFPMQGMTDVRASHTGLAAALDVAHHLALPALTYAIYQVALVYRLTRAKMRETLTQDYIVLARAKGATARSVVWRHAVPNAALPVVTVVGYNLGYLLAGAALIETVFGWPGVGRLLFEAVNGRDTPLLLGLFLVTSTAVIIAALLTDVLYAVLDPRVTYDRKQR